MASWKWPNVLNKMLGDIPGINVLLNALLKQDVSGTTDVPSGAKQWVDTPEGKQFQVFNGQSWASVGKLAHDAASVDGYSASIGTTANTIPVRNASGKLPGDILGSAATASKAAALSATNPVNMGGTGATTAEQARTNLGVPPTDHASSSTEYGIGSSANYGHVKLSNSTSSTSSASSGGIAASPKAVKTAKEEAISAAGEALEAFAGAQATKDAAQDAAIRAAQSSADEKVATVNGLTPDSNGNVDVGGMPLGTLIPYTGKNVPAGTLRADGSTYNNMRSSFPDFYEWVVNSGLTVSLADYALVEGSCGYYGLDTSTGTVRMPTLAAGVFGTTVAGQYGQAVQAGLPNITGELINAATTYVSTGDINDGGALRWKGTNNKTNIDTGDKRAIKTLNFDASRSNSIYGNSDTVTPSHVKYPWVIVVYNDAVLPSVAQAGEFVELLDGKLDKANGVMEGPLTVSRIRFVNPAGKEMGYFYSDNSDLDEISLSLTGAQFSRLGEGSNPIQDVYTNHLYGGFVHANMSQSVFMFYKNNEDVTFTIPNGGTWAVHMLAGTSYGDIGNHSRAETLAGGSSHNWGKYYRAYVWGYRVA